MTTPTRIIYADEITAALRDAGWTPTPRWATPEERERCDLVVISIPQSYEVHVLAGGGGSGTPDVLEDLKAAGIPATRRGVYAVVNSK
jgi:hypothetical protein